MGKSLLARVPAPVKLGVPVAAGLLAAACGSAAASPSGSQASGSHSSAPASSGTATATVIASHAGSGGTFLTDGGRAVYLWNADAMNKSNCSGACAGAWPPVMAAGKVTASNGVKPSDLGTIARSGGGRQVTYNGHPLYFFAGDSGPGQTHGQGSDSFGAKWWLVAPSGSQITAADTAASSSGSGPMAPSGGSSAGGSWG